MTWIPWVIVVLVVIGIAIFVNRSPDSNVDDGAPMPSLARRLLVGYLLVVGCCLAYVVLVLTYIDFPELALVPEASSIYPNPATSQAATVNNGTPTPAPEEKGTRSNGVPVVLRIFPQYAMGSAPTVSLAIYGQNFSEESRLRINTKPDDLRKPDTVTADLFTAKLESKDLLGVGRLTVDIVNGSKISNALALPIVKPAVTVTIFGGSFPVNREVQLLLLVLLAGALGSYVHAIKSLSDFIGNRTLTASWFWWYITRPFLGMAMALIFYAVLRGGFLAGTPADAKVVNPFGVIAIGALVGMFADKATQKLADVFEILFKADDSRGGKLTAPAIDKIDPQSIHVGETQPVVLRITGDRLGKVSSVRLNSVEHKPDTVNEKELTLKLRPEDVQKVGDVSITVVNPDGGISAAVTLHVTDLAIATPTANSLAEGQVGGAYQESVVAKGGAPPYQWSVVNAPTWLTIDQKTGSLQGKPVAPGSSQVTIKVTDKNGSSASRVFDLKVNA